MNTSLRADVPSPPSREQRQAEVIAALKDVLPSGSILFRHEDTVPYECDALTAYRTSPMVVVLPETAAQVAAILKICHRMGVPVIARGAGTGLSGGATPHHGGVILSLAKFNKILEIDAAACTAFSRFSGPSDCGSSCARCAPVNTAGLSDASRRSAR